MQNETQRMTLVVPGRVPSTVVNGYAEASGIFAKARAASGEGASTFPDGKLIAQDGETVAWISYNGRVWSTRTYAPIYEPS